MRNTEKKEQKNAGVQFLTVPDGYEGTRIDNFLLNRLKGLPKSRLYRILRKGEVRVNKKRIDPSYRIQVGDIIRIPPVFLEEKAKQIPPSKDTISLLKNRILYEDDNLIVINKPSGMSVHAGNTVRVGVVEAMKAMYPKLVNLELAHRLDSETSGCLILAKKRSILRQLHELLREGKVKKIYYTLTLGIWKQSELKVNLPLHKDYQDGGKHVVRVDSEGKTALTIFRTIKAYENASLMEANLHTGRTHQIRVHAKSQGHPIAGDDRYGDQHFNKRMKNLGLRRMFLHAKSINFTLPSSNEHITVVAPLDPNLEEVLKALEV